MAKIHGRTSFESRTTIHIIVGQKPDGTPDTIPATLKVLPLDLGDRLLRRLPPPVPPRRPLRDSKGPIRDKDGRPIIAEDTSDPDFIKARTAHAHRMGIAGFVEALDDPEWRFDAARPTEPAEPGAWAAYYEAIYQELCQIGFPARAFNQLAREVQILAGMKDEDLEREAAGFSQGAAETAPVAI